MLTELRLRDLIAAGRRIAASDIHITAGCLIHYRVDGHLCRLDDDVIEGAELRAMLALLLNGAQQRRLRMRGQADGAIEFGATGRVRVHAYRSQRGFEVALRLLSTAVPDAYALELPPVLLQRTLKAKGLMLFAGPTGSGKTTAMAACLEYINQRADQHIVTIEDPVEYLLPPFRAHISQRQVGRDVRSFDAGIHAALRSDPDVIAIGELRNARAIAAALRAAETGHLVLATIHSDGAVGAVERIIGAFGRDGSAVRPQLAAVLEAILAVTLLPRRGGGRIFGSELLLGTDAVRALIREGKAHQLESALATGRNVGMYTLAMRIAELTARGEMAA